MPVSPPEVEDLQRAGSSLASRVRGLEAIAREARDRIHLTQEQLQRHSTWITHHKGEGVGSRTTRVMRGLDHAPQG